MVGLLTQRSAAVLSCMSSSAIWLPFSSMCHGTWMLMAVYESMHVQALYQHIMLP